MNISSRVNTTLGYDHVWPHESKGSRSQETRILAQVEHFSAPGTVYFVWKVATHENLTTTPEPGNVHFTNEETEA